MFTYLGEFFKEFDYREQDASHLLACAHKIFDNDTAREFFEKALAAYDADQNCDFGQCMHYARRAGSTADVHNYTAELLLFI